MKELKKYIETIGVKIPCSIEILTPVHIGSGVKLASGIDFLSTHSSVTIVTQAELMEHLENDLEERDLFVNGGYKE